MPSTDSRAIATAVLVVASGFTGAAHFATGAAAAQESASFETVDGTVRVHAVDRATVSGDSTLDPGTVVTLQLRSTAEGDAFIKNPEVTIQEDGSFSAPFNFSHIDVGTDFTVSLRDGADVIASADGSVVAQDARVEPTTTSPPTTASTTASTTSTGGESGGSVPGFTLASGVAAFCAVAVFGSRRA